MTLNWKDRSRLQTYPIAFTKNEVSWLSLSSIKSLLRLIDYKSFVICNCTTILPACKTHFSCLSSLTLQMIWVPPSLTEHDFTFCDMTFLVIAYVLCYFNSRPSDALTPYLVVYSITSPGRSLLSRLKSISQNYFKFVTEAFRALIVIKFIFNLFNQLRLWIF